MDNKKIKDIRGKMGLSQERFAALVGVTRVTIARWEDGIVQPSPLAERMLQQIEKETEGDNAKR